MRIVVLIFLTLACLALGACGGGGGTDTATTGSIEGVVTVGGPFIGSLTLHVGLVDSTTGEIAMEDSVGHITSATTVDGRELQFSYDQIPFGSYNLCVYYQPGAEPEFIYKSDELVFNAQNHSISGFNGQCSFTGDEPWGTISGRINLEGEWPAERIVFVGFTPTGTSTTYQFVVQEESVVGGVTEYTEHQTDGTVVFNIAHIAYGTYDVALYTYNPTTHVPTVCGAHDEPVTVSASEANVTHVNFPADFAGDPGADPELGSISGTITFDGVMPTYLETSENFVSVAANTFPPQQGAPPSDMKIKPSMLGASYTVAYELPDLPYGEYNVSVFLYNMATHVPVYLGWYGGSENPGHVTVDAATAHIENIDFSASVAPLS